MRNPKSRNFVEEPLKLKGSDNMRMRLLLSTLSNTPITISDIRTEEMPVGLRPYEISFLELLMKVSNGGFIEINDTGTRVELYKPGTVMGGKDLVHNCGTDRAIGYFLEPLIVLGLYGKKPLSIKLIGITNDSKDPSVDTFRTTTLPMLKQFGVPSEGLDLKIVRRGVPPLGDGEVILSVPIVQDTLKAVTWIDEGLVKSISGFTFSIFQNKAYSQFHENQMLDAARGIFRPLLENKVHIYKTRPQVGKSPGYGISLVAETTSGCFKSADAVSYSRDELLEDEEKDLISAEDVGEITANALMGEIEQRGVVDPTHQGLLFLLCALSSKDVSKIRVGELSPYGIQVLGCIKDFLNVTFYIEHDASTESVILTCIGCGLKNLSTKAC